MKSNSVVLDATLRDGGLVNSHFFCDSFVKKLYRANSDAGIDYMEFGYRADRRLFPTSDYGKWKFSSDDDIWSIVGDNRGPQVSVMVDVGRCDYKNDISDKSNSPVDLFRVATYADQLDEATKMIEYIYQKGYKVTCNIMATSECNESQRKKIVSILKQLPLEAVYIVDSFGALYPADIKRITEEYLEALCDTSIEVGVHTHNNLQLAFANTIEGLNSGANWLDATFSGLGRGAGNCLMELLVGYLSDSKYKISPILEFVDSELPKLDDDVKWGYNSYYLLTGISNVHPRSAISASRKGDKSIREFMSELH